MNLIDLDDPFDHINLHEIISTTDDPDEVDNLVHLTWCAIVNDDDEVMVVIGYQRIDDDLVSVSGWMAHESCKTFLAKSIYIQWLRFLVRLRLEGYTHIYASTLKTNKQGIRFNEHAGYVRNSEDDTTIYWLKEL